MLDSNLLIKLSQNLLEILNDEEYYDITIEVGNDPYVKVYYIIVLLICKESYQQIKRKMMELWYILNYQIFYLKFFK